MITPCSWRAKKRTTGRSGRGEPGIRQRQPAALKQWAAQLGRELEVFKYWQFEFFQQWHKLKTYCQERGIRIMGDIPIYVAHDSADVWAHPDLFQLDQQGKPAVVAGVPPDYFSATGQLWGNPIYRWEVMADLGYGWWIDRFRASLNLFDMVRLDHFRGFEAYWEIPSNAPTAAHGRWVKAPGGGLFRRLQAALGELPVGDPRSGGAAQGVWLSGHESAAVCLRFRSARALVPPAQLFA